MVQLGSLESADCVLDLVRAHFLKVILLRLDNCKVWYNGTQPGVWGCGGHPRLNRGKTAGVLPQNSSVMSPAQWLG